MKKCKIEGCQNNQSAKGYCPSHYYKAVRYGDPLAGVKYAKPREYHGLRRSVNYSVWNGIIQRCTNPNEKRYMDYGGRGITVCDEWRYSFIRFNEDMGERPGCQYQIDRIDNAKGYFKENCRWVTRLVNARNKRSVKLSQEKADEMRSLRAAGATQRFLAEKFGITTGGVRSVLRGKTWQTDIMEAT